MGSHAVPHAARASHSAPSQGKEMFRPAKLLAPTLSTDLAAYESYLSAYRCYQHALKALKSEFWSDVAVVRAGGGSKSYEFRQRKVTVPAVTKSVTKFQGVKQISGREVERSNVFDTVDQVLLHFGAASTALLADRGWRIAKVTQQVEVKAAEEVLTFGTVPSATRWQKPTLTKSAPKEAAPADPLAIKERRKAARRRQQKARRHRQRLARCAELEEKKLVAEAELALKKVEKRVADWTLVQSKRSKREASQKGVSTSGGKATTASPGPKKTTAIEEAGSPPEQAAKANRRERRRAIYSPGGIMRPSILGPPSEGSAKAAPTVRVTRTFGAAPAVSSASSAAGDR